MRLAKILLVFFSLQLLSCSDQENVIPYHEHKVKIDGSKKDYIWKITEVYDEFYSPWSEKKIEKTEFRSFHNSVFLYFHFTIIDKTIYCNQQEQYPASVEYSDRAEIFFTIDAQLSEYYGLEIDACGRMMSFKSESYRSFEEDWKFPGFGKKDFKVIQTNNGYQVEGRIALNVLRDLGVLKEQQMLIGIFRANFYQKNLKDKVQWISWKPIDSKIPDFHDIQGFKSVFLGD